MSERPPRAAIVRRECCTSATPRQGAWGAAFCERVAAGETITAITADPAMPSVKAVYAWLKRHEEFLDMYLEARAEQKRWLEFNIDMVVMEATPATFRSAKAEVARLEGLIGRLTAKTYRP